MRRLQEAVGEKVVSRGTAEQVGALRHIVVDAGTGRIAALHVDGRKKKAHLVDWQRVVAFGPDAIMVDGEDALRTPGDDYEVEVASGKLDLIGRRVLSDAGDELGALEDIEFDEADGALQALLVGGQRWDAKRLRAIGPYCVLVASDQTVATPPDPVTTGAVIAGDPKHS